MEKHYTEVLTVEAMAKHLHMSRSYLYRIFKQNLGISPRRAILNFRLEKASILVERGGIPLTEIALSCGFYDLSHFSKAYKERYEQYPKAEKNKKSKGDSCAILFSNTKGVGCICPKTLPCWIIPVRPHRISRKYILPKSALMGFLTDDFAFEIIHKSTWHISTILLFAEKE